MKMKLPQQHYISMKCAASSQVAHEQYFAEIIDRVKNEATKVAVQCNIVGFSIDTNIKL